MKNGGRQKLPQTVFFAADSLTLPLTYRAAKRRLFAFAAR
jgi:hypothetical protein